MNVGEVREWLIRLVSKTSMAAMSSRVRIPPSPPRPTTSREAQRE